MYCATQGHRQTGISFVNTTYVSRKMVACQNVTAVTYSYLWTTVLSFLVEKFHRFIQQHVLYCIGQAHAGSSLRVYYPHWASSGHCHGRSRSRTVTSRAVTVLCTCEDITILQKTRQLISVHRQY